jgi:hypothetical protein
LRKTLLNRRFMNSSNVAKSNSSRAAGMLARADNHHWKTARALRDSLMESPCSRMIESRALRR